MFKSKTLIFCFISLIAAQHAMGMSCIRKELNSQESADYLATQKYSPFSYMMGTSLVSGLGGYIALASHKDSQGEYDVPGWVNSISIATLSASVMLTMMESGCRPVISDSTGSYDAKMNGKVLKMLKNRRRSFLALYTFNVVPLLLATPYSSRDDRVFILAGGVLLPLVTDLFLRYTFKKDKVSPWKLRPSFQISEQGTVSMLNLHFRW